MDDQFSVLKSLGEKQEERKKEKEIKKKKV